MAKRIYLDHSATTPVDPRVIEAMMPAWTEAWGNPSSVHGWGREANSLLENARESIAKNMGVGRPRSQIIFTASGSEADNLALRGVMLNHEKGSHFITSTIEHKAILDTAKQLRDLHGYELTILPVDKLGKISLADLENAIQSNTVLVSIMAANNEIGTTQPIDAIGTLCRERDILFHTDAVQTIGTTQYDFDNQAIDLLTIAPHKFYGPKGIGILVVREGLDLIPSITGGGQEEGRRPGTENIAFALGTAKALELAVSENHAQADHYIHLRDTLIAGILDAFDGETAVLTGHPTERLPFHASFAFKHLRGNDLLMHLDMAGIAASSGSACSVGNPSPSRTLQAIGLDTEWTLGGLRLSLGKGNQMADVERGIAAVTDSATSLKALTAYQS